MKLGMSSEEIPFGISDHDLIYTSRNKCKQPKNTYYIWTRGYRRYDKYHVRKDIDRLCWDFILDMNDVDQALETFMINLERIINTHAPYKWIKCKEEMAKWITNEFLGLIDVR